MGSLAAADGDDDLQAVTVGNDGLAMRAFRHDLAIALDRNFFSAERERLHELGERQGGLKAEDYRLQHATEGYLQFLKLGGRLRFLDLTTELIHSVLRKKLPIITGLSSTYLYRSAREFGPENVADDVAGLPAGHFVVIAGYNEVRRTLLVVDPYQPTPYGPSHEYWLGAERVLGAILLGIVTHDANLLVVHPPP